MITPNSGPQPDYGANPTVMREAIDWYLKPVVEQLGKITRNYTEAHAEVKTAHDSETPGWFGEVGNGDVRMMSGSFLNAAEWQLRQLVQDQAELHISLSDYQAMLLEHLAVAEDTEHRIASRFRAIDAGLEGQGRCRCRCHPAAARCPSQASTRRPIRNWPRPPPSSTPGSTI